MLLKIAGVSRAGCSAWPSWRPAVTRRRMPGCWCSGMRTRYCSGTRKQPKPGRPPASPGTPLNNAGRGIQGLARSPALWPTAAVWVPPCWPGGGQSQQGPDRALPARPAEAPGLGSAAGGWVLRWAGSDVGLCAPGDLLRQPAAMVAEFAARGAFPRTGRSPPARQPVKAEPATTSPVIRSAHDAQLTVSRAQPVDGYDTRSCPMSARWSPAVSSISPGRSAFDTHSGAPGRNGR